MRTVTTVKVWMTIAGAMALAAIGVVAQTSPAGGAAPPQAAANPCGPTTPQRGGGMLAGAGPSDKPVVDAAAADRAKPVYVAECLTCHGTMARGTAKGPNLVRSLVVLRDRCGSELGPYLKGAHKAQSATAAANTGFARSAAAGSTTGLSEGPAPASMPPPRWGVVGPHGFVAACGGAPPPAGRESPR